jgi:hypothetical protein
MLTRAKIRATTVANKTNKQRLIKVLPEVEPNSFDLLLSSETKDWRTELTGLADEVQNTLHPGEIFVEGGTTNTRVRCDPTQDQGFLQ